MSIKYIEYAKNSFTSVNTEKGGHGVGRSAILLLHALVQFQDIGHGRTVDYIEYALTRQ